MKEVQFANPFEPGSLNSRGHICRMIFRQRNFPLYFEDHEQHLEGDHDRILAENYNRAYACIEKYTGSGEGVLQQWFSDQSDENVFAFIKEYLQADQKILWTGYRIQDQGVSSSKPWQYNLVS